MAGVAPPTHLVGKYTLAPVEAINSVGSTLKSNETVWYRKCEEPDRSHYKKLYYPCINPLNNPPPRVYAAC